MKDMVVTIDGPAGAGKTTVSRALAARLGYRYVDTGALYRGVALAARERGIEPEDDAGLSALCEGLQLELILADGACRLIADGVDITDRIRTPEISMLASAVSARPVVRAFLLGLQRRLGAEKRAVFEGRDMGTVVFPEAEVKFFLNASVEERALRRFKEMPPDAGQTLEEVAADIRRRDENDQTRAQAPLKPAEDAIRVDSTRMSVEAVVEFMLERIHIKVQ